MPQKYVYLFILIKKSLLLCIIYNFPVNHFTVSVASNHILVYTCMLYLVFGKFS